MANKETGNNAAVNFLGRVMREQPEIIEELPPRDAYILFAHSDQKDGKALSELGEIFSISKQGVHQIYHRYIERIFKTVAPHIQEATSLVAIYESVSRSSPGARVRNREAQRRRFEDPQRREWLNKHLEHMRELSQSPDARAKRRGKKRSEETRAKMKEAWQKRKSQSSIAT